MVGLVVLNYNDFKTTIELLNRVKKYSSISKIVVVDNFSTDGSYEIIQTEFYDCSKIDVIRTKKNGGYGYGNNEGINYLVSTYHIRYVLICNPDVIFEERTVISLLKSLMEYKNVAVVSPLMYNGARELQAKSVWKIPSATQYMLFSTILLKNFCDDFYYSKDVFNNSMPWEAECVAGSMLMVDIEKFENVRIYDENIFLYCEETVLGMKVKSAGWKSMLIPSCSFFHLHSISVNKSIPKEIERDRLMWRSRLYVLKRYMKCNIIKMIAAKLIMNTTILEKKIRLILKRN